MIIDFHTHIFPDDIRSRREDYYPAEPEFEQLYRSPKSKLIGAAEIVAAMDKEGVDKSVVFGFPWQTPDTFRRHNDYVLESVMRYPDRLIGFGCVHPLSPGAADEAQRCIDSGMAGIGELAFYRSDLDDRALDRLAPIMQICRRRDLPVMIHVNEPLGREYPGKSTNTLGQIYALAKRYARNKLVLAHWGGGIFLYLLLKKEVKETLANVYYDTAASPYVYDLDIFPLAVRLAGIEKILFGSDFPLISPSRYFSEMARTGLTREQRRRIQGHNAQNLLGL
jgi:predicted TIM-barrel fold metal-dependent hydrolase